MKANAFLNMSEIVFLQLMKRIEHRLRGKSKYDFYC